MLTIDYAIIVLYLVSMIALGFYYRRKASRNAEAYFLGDKGIHWMALGISGASAFFDVTGTMWIVSMIFILGMRSMWVHWMWGFMMGAFCLAYMGKWCRRSNVMTGAEWMMTRFGSGRGGALARDAATFLAVFTTTSFIGYAFQGIGKFASVYLPLSPALCSILLFSITTVYCLLGGFYSVVITDVIQAVILTLASILIAAIAYVNLSPEILGRVLPLDWTSLAPVWRLDSVDARNAEYQLFGLFIIVWVLKGFLLNMGGPAQMYDFQRFVAARDSRDAARVGAIWNVFLIVRWGLAAGIALMAIAGVINETDPEKIMPVVLHDFIPGGFRGFVIAGLLSAFMSTFSATINCGASYLVRDVWQRHFRPNATERQLVRASHWATIGIVIAGVLIGTQAKSITQIWDWIMMALGAGVVMPNFLRWYWWRLNGQGYAAGMLAGVLFALIAWFAPDSPLYIVFPTICAGSLLISIVVSFITRPVDEEVLLNFYRSVRPFGIWGPIRFRAGLTTRERCDTCESPWRAAFNVAMGMVATLGYFVSPMYLVGHWHTRALVWFLAATAATVTLAFTWYPYLPKEGEN